MSALKVPPRPRRVKSPFVEQLPKEWRKSAKLPPLPQPKPTPLPKLPSLREPRGP